MKSYCAALVVAAANALIEEDDTGSQDAETFARGSAVFVNHIGYRSHLLYRYSNWPFPLKATPEDMAHQARRDGVLHVEEPKPGEIFLKWSASRGRFVGAGIVLSALPLSQFPAAHGGFLLELCTGSANMDCSGEGVPLTSVDWAMRVMVQTAPLMSEDRFIAWDEADYRDASAVHVITRNTRTLFRSTAPAWAARSHNERK